MCLETVFVCIFVCIFVYFRAFLLLANLNFSPQKSRFADTTFDTKDRREKTHALTNDETRFSLSTHTHRERESALPRYFAAFFFTVVRL